MVYCLEVVSDHGINIQVHPHVTGATALSEIKERADKGRSGLTGKNQDCFVLPLVSVAPMAKVLDLGAAGSCHPLWLHLWQSTAPHS